MFYRIHQFLEAMTAQITQEDLTFYKKYLTLKETVLFEKLKVYDQKHSLRTAYWLKEKTGGNKEMIRLGLLHDIGKLVYPLNPFKKAIMVLVDKGSKGRLKGHSKLRMVKGYYDHPQLGYELLKAEGGYEETFLQLIRMHHTKGSSHEPVDDRLKWLQEADDQS